MADWQTQIRVPSVRQYVPIPKHSGGPTQGRRGTPMDLDFVQAQQVLREAVYDPVALTSATKAPSLWAYHEARIYRFMWDNFGGWHGYPTEEKPPNAVLQHWRQTGVITEPEYSKIRRYPNRGS
jgi:hypothetical protein